MERTSMKLSSEDKARSRVVLRVRSRSGDAPAQETAPLSPPASGLLIGAASPVAFCCNRDVNVDAAHGTLERTASHGVWVFVDHSALGSTLNGRTRVHRDAVIVRSGDTLTVGSTDITIAIVQPEAAAAVEVDDKRRVYTNVASNISSSSMNAGRRRSMPKQIVPRIDTSPARPELQPPAFKRATSASAAAVGPTAAAPEYINSPIPGTNWRRRRNSMVTTTTHAPLFGNDALASTKAIPSPPIGAGAQPFAYPRGRMLVSPAPTATSSASSSNLNSPNMNSEAPNVYQRQHQLYIRTGSPKLAPPPPPPSPPPASPIPLEYSSSPVSSPSPFMRRLHERHELEGKQTTPDLGSRLGAFAGIVPDAGPPKSRRDDLRIQVSKKMAAAAAEGKGSGGSQRERQIRARHLPATTDTLARIHQRHLEFTPPSSPVPQSDLQRQQRSLLATLKLKYKEEQLLKQQQEEWMRRQFDVPRARSAGDRTPPLSPIRSRQTVHPTTPTASLASSRDSSPEDEEEEHSPLSTSELRALIPDRLPELLRTLSTGQQAHLPSPRVTAALMASRAARANAANHLRRQQDDDVAGGDVMHEDTRMRPTSKIDDGESCTKEANRRPRARSSSTSSSDSVSVSSSVTTEPARYRRVTRSLSVGSSNVSDASENASEGASEPRSSPPSPLEVGCSRGDLGIPDFFVGYDDDTDEEDEPAAFRFYPDDESVSRSREDSVSLVDSATSKSFIEYDTAAPRSPLSSSSSESSTPPSSGLFSLDTLRSPRRLTDDQNARHRSHRHYDYLLSKSRGPESDGPNGEDAGELRRTGTARKSSIPVVGSDYNNNALGALQDGKALPPARGRRRRSAPPGTMTLGLPTSKLALSLAPTPPSNHLQDNDTSDQPELDGDNYTHDRSSPPPPSPPPSAEAPAHGVGPHRPSFRRRSAFALS